MGTTKKLNSAQPKKRGRGKRAGLDLAQIVEVARSLAPAAVTMQAVADELGVDRKALNYYVADRESLLKLVATGVFSSSFAAVHISQESSWQEACSAYGRGLADSIIETGVLTEHVRMSTSMAEEFLPPAEAVLGKLIAAGLDEGSAARVLALLSTICTGYASDVVAAASAKEKPLDMRLQQALRDARGQSLKHIERITASTVRTYDRAQLELSIEIFIGGTEILLQKARKS
jgi:AcrR family transcriptional regulator